MFCIVLAYSYLCTQKKMKQLDRDILKIALPSIVTNVTVPLLGLCDVAVMGHVGGAESIGAIAVGSMAFNVIYWLLGFLRMGTSGLTAQAFGAGDSAAMRGTLRQGLTTALTLGLLFVVLQVPLRHAVLWVMQAPADVATLITPYFNICIWGAPAVLGLYVFTGWFIGMQNTRIPMVIAILQNVLNIAASLFFVLILDMGISGVALGTMIAQWIGFALAVVKSISYLPPVEEIRKDGAAGFHPVEEIRKDGAAGFHPAGWIRGGLYIHIFLRTVCLVAVNLYFTSAGAAQGPLILAANTLLMQLFTLFSYVMDGFANAGEALAGRYTGAHDAAMLRCTVSRLFQWGLAMTIIFTLVYSVGGTPFLHLLTTDATVVDAATTYQPWTLLIPVAGMGAFVWDGIFIGITRSRGMLVSSAVAAAAFFAVFFLLSPTLANNALWLAFLVFLAMRGVVQTALYLLFPTKV